MFDIHKIYINILELYSVSVQQKKNSHNYQITTKTKHNKNKILTDSGLTNKLYL